MFEKDPMDKIQRENCNDNILTRAGVTAALSK